MEKIAPKTYEVSEFKQILNIVNEDNLEGFVVDFAQFLAFYVKAIADLRKQHPEETKGLSNTDIADSGFTWVDDKKTDILWVDVKNKDTGEVTRVVPEDAQCQNEGRTRTDIARKHAYCLYNR